jgi:hypothetical protein
MLGPSDGPGDRAGDAGAELQTDVMRFFAILALCVLALSTLVRELPPERSTGQASGNAAPRAIPGAAEARPARAHVVTPAPSSAPTRPLAPPPAPTTASPAEVPGDPVQAEAATSPPSRAGFTLRFEDDATLLALVGDGMVGLHVRSGPSTLKWIDGRFVQHPLPDSLYLMHPATVPAALAGRLARDDASGVTWGVTLPAATRQAIESALAGRRGGELVIGPDGAVTVEGG